MGGGRVDFVFRFYNWGLERFFGMFCVLRELVLELGFEFMITFVGVGNILGEIRKLESFRRVVLGKRFRFGSML